MFGEQLDHCRSWDSAHDDMRTQGMHDGIEGLLDQRPDSGHRGGPLGWKLEQKQARGAEHSNELRYVLLCKALWHVLERDGGVHEIELPVIKPAQIARFVHQVFTTADVTVIAAGVFDHGRRDIDAAHMFEMGGEGLGEPSDATAEIESGFLLPQRMDRSGVLEHRVDFYCSSSKEPLGVPGSIAFFSARQNGSERVLAAKGVPMLLERAKAQLPIIK